MPTEAWTPHASARAEHERRERAEAQRPRLHAPPAASMPTAHERDAITDAGNMATVPITPSAIVQHVVLDLCGDADAALPQGLRHD